MFATLGNEANNAKYQSYQNNCYIHGCLLPATFTQGIGNVANKWNLVKHAQ